MNDSQTGTNKRRRRVAFIGLPGAFRGPEAARYIGMSYRAFGRLNSAGKLPAPIKVGGVVLWTRATLDRWLSLECPDRKTFEKLNQA